MKPYNDSIKVLWKGKKYFNETRKELDKEIEKTKSDDSLKVINKKINDLGDNAFTEPVKRINGHLDSINKEKYLWCYNYYDQNQTIVSYYLILKELLYLYNDKYSDLSKVKILLRIFLPNIRIINMTRLQRNGLWVWRN